MIESNLMKNTRLYAIYESILQELEFVGTTCQK